MKVIIRKLDGDTKETLDGAALQIRSVEGQTGAEHIVQEGISGENPEGKGTFVFHAPHPGTYHIYETMAPDGYERTESYCEFTVKEDGSTEGSLTVYNFKRKKTLGQIRAVYQPKNRFGNFTYGSGSGSGAYAPEIPWRTGNGWFCHCCFWQECSLLCLSVKERERDDLEQ